MQVTDLGAIRLMIYATDKPADVVLLGEKNTCHVTHLLCLAVVSLQTHAEIKERKPRVCSLREK
jgi:hypothetical protein